MKNTIRTIVFATLAITIVSCSAPKENPKFKALLSSCLESDTASVLHFVSDHDTISIKNTNNFYSFGSCAHAPLAACPRQARYAVSVAYAGDGWNIGYRIDYEEISKNLEMDGNITNKSSNISFSCYPAYEVQDIFGAIESGIYITDIYTDNSDYIKVNKAIGMTEFKVNGKVYVRL